MSDRQLDESAVPEPRAPLDLEAIEFKALSVAYTSTAEHCEYIRQLLAEVRHLRALAVVRVDPPVQKLISQIDHCLTETAKEGLGDYGEHLPAMGKFLRDVRSALAKVVLVDEQTVPSDCEICRTCDGIAGMPAVICAEHYRRAVQGEADTESSAASTKASATPPDAVTNRVVPNGEDSGRIPLSSSSSSAPTVPPASTGKDYDAPHDVLYVAWGESTHGQEPVPGVILRYSATGVLVGVTLYDLKRVLVSSSSSGVTATEDDDQEDEGTRTLSRRELLVELHQQTRCALISQTALQAERDRHLASLPPPAPRHDLKEKL